MSSLLGRQKLRTSQQLVLVLGFFLFIYLFFSMYDLLLGIPLHSSLLGKTIVRNFFSVESQNHVFTDQSMRNALKISHPAFENNEKCPAE